MSKIDFYDISHILSYNRIFNFVLGNRTAGKSFSAKCHVIRKFLQTGRQFIYLRRYDNELKNLKTLFDDVSFKFPETSFSVKGQELYINDDLAGFAIPLSLQHKIKSGSYVNVDTIIFDEFLVEKRTGYLPAEVDLFLSLYLTVNRGGGKVNRDVKVLFIANNVSAVNPYFAHFKIFPKIGINKGVSWVCETFVNGDVVNAYENTQIGHVLKNTKYGDYALNGQFYLDNYSFIDKRVNLKGYYLRAVLKNDGKLMGIWHNSISSQIYVSKKCDMFCPFKYCFDPDDLADEWVLMFRGKKTPLIKILSTAYEHCLIKFESLELKINFLQTLAIVY